jgi:hypothetical protein
MHFVPKATTVLLAAATLAAATLGAGVSPSHAQSCQALWVERNSYYRAAGYCFKTVRAIAYFGNIGCIYDRDGDVPLVRSVRYRIAQITRLERALGCND